jgi:hypothetical protein
LTSLESGVPTLIEDLTDRGLLDETLVETIGDFGRTPRNNANLGRDHWGNAISAMIAGGGNCDRQAIGSTDDNQICRLNYHLGRAKPPGLVRPQARRPRQHSRQVRRYRDVAAGDSLSRVPAKAGHSY